MIWILKYLPTYNSQHNFFTISECPPTLGGERQFFCPTPNENEEWTCVTLDQLCNTKYNCPNGEDEDETMCLFHRPVRYFWKIVYVVSLSLWHNEYVS